MCAFQIDPLSQENRHQAVELLVKQWGTTQMVSRGRLYDVPLLPGYLATDESGPVGLSTFDIDGNGCELVTLNCLIERAGIGSSLIAAVKAVAEAAGCRRLWLITTNDNTPALRFYQKRGFHLVAVHRNALEQSRRLKPEIPLFGLDGIPLRDEIELEMLL